MADPATPPDPPVPATPAGLRALLKQAQCGDASTLPALRAMLRDPSAIAQLGGNLAAQAEHSFISEMAGENLAFREAVGRKLELLRADLLGPAPTPVERLLAERATACWLQVQDADMRYAQGQGKATLRQLDYYLRRMNAAHSRFLSALKILSTVRRLALPAIQVNIADRQVNLAAGTDATQGRVETTR